MIMTIMSSLQIFTANKKDYHYEYCTNLKSTKNHQGDLLLFEEIPIYNTKQTHLKPSETILSIVLFQDHNNDNNHSNNSCGDVNASQKIDSSCSMYMCRISQNLKRISFYSSKPKTNYTKCNNNNNNNGGDDDDDDHHHLDPTIIRFDGRVMTQFEDMDLHWETTSSETLILKDDSDLRQETSSLSQTRQMNTITEKLSKTLGGNVNIQPVYNVIDLEPDIIFLDEDNQHKKIMKTSCEKYCWVTKFDSQNQQQQQHQVPYEVYGFVFSITVPMTTLNDMDTQQHSSCNVIPTPLLSISLSRVNNIDNRNIYNHDQYISKNDHEDNEQLNVLLMQCLKRQLIGTLLNLDSSVRLLAPNDKNHNLETYYFQINDVLPYRQNSRITSYSNIVHSDNVLLYQVLPSTRITIDNDTHQQIDHTTQFLGTEKVHTDNNVPQHEEILINTIKSIRHCSKMSPGSHYSVDIPRVFLLSGSPGVGKTYSVRKAIETSKNVGPTKLISLRGSELLSNGNESDAAHELTKIFNSALSFVEKQDNSVALLFMDECDALFSSVIVSASLASFLDQMTSKIVDSNKIDRFAPAWKRLLVVAATNRIDAVPSMLRRPGRFDREICISPPNTQQRFDILKNILNGIDSSIGIGNTRDKSHQKNQGLIQCNDKVLIAVAELCVGYVASDLAALARKSVLIAIKNECRNIDMETFKAAMKDVGASALRDSAINAPPTTRWSDIAGDAGGAKTALRQAIEWPKVKRKQFERLGLNPPRGILLHGPPGCAKTTLVRAAAGSIGVAFLSLSPADVYASSYVGEAEAVIRRAFSLARSAAPCILFFDEIDTIVGTSNNQSGMDRGTNAEARVLSTFLNEMDGIDGSINDGVLVLGATNRPSTLDTAILRPGRFDRVIYVPPPDQEGRKQILKAQCNVDLVDFDYLASEKVSGSMTGAEIVGACREAAMLAVREAMEGTQNTRMVPIVLQRHIEQSLQMCTPLLSNQSVLNEYMKFEQDQNKKY